MRCSTAPGSHHGERVPNRAASSARSRWASTRAGREVIHLLAPGRSEPHPYTSAARIVDGGDRPVPNGRDGARIPDRQKRRQVEPRRLVDHPLIDFAGIVTGTERLVVQRTAGRVVLVVAVVVQDDAARRQVGQERLERGSGLGLRRCTPWSARGDVRPSAMSDLADRRRALDLAVSGKGAGAAALKG